MSQSEQLSEVFPDSIASVDHSIFGFLNGTLHHPILDAFFGFITNFEHFKIPLAIAGVLVLIFGNAKFRLTAITATVAVLLADMIGMDLKLNFARHRPFWVLEDVRQILGESSSRSPSFPSNHAVNTAAAGMTFALAYWRKWWIVAPAIVVPLLVGYSRVYVGVHFPLDVLAGFFVGVSVSTGLWLINRVEPVLSTSEGRMCIGWKGLGLFLVGVATLYRFSTAARAQYPLMKSEGHAWYLTNREILWWDLHEFFSQVIYKPWFMVMGSSEFDLRALAVVFSLVGIVATWWLCNHLGYTKRARVVALFLVLLSPFHILGALFLSEASISLGLVPLVLLVGLIYIRTPDARLGAVYILLVLVEAALAGAGVLVAAALFLRLIGRGEKKGDRWVLLAAMVGGIAVLVHRALLMLLTIEDPIAAHPSLPPGWLVLVAGFPLFCLLLFFFLPFRGVKLEGPSPISGVVVQLAWLFSAFVFLTFRVDLLAWGGLAWLLLALASARRIDALFAVEAHRRWKWSLGMTGLATAVFLGFWAASVHDRAVWRSVQGHFHPKILPALDPATGIYGSREVGSAIKQLHEEEPVLKGASILVNGLPPQSVLYYSGVTDPRVLVHRRQIGEGALIYVSPFKRTNPVGWEVGRPPIEVRVMDRRNLHRTMYIRVVQEASEPPGEDSGVHLIDP
ncbi:MAG: phosphatase PAP2 family protein [Candidatus Sumerlaeia bacterium]|nr:phosphatase PAP2 family protein [Candidatus Sumerlaeia bacterium]